MLTKSTEIKNIAAALVKTQGALKGAKKDTNNPFFKSKYANLESVWDACRDALQANGIAVVQTATNQLVPTQTDAMNFIGVTTILAHESGEFISDTCYARAKDDGAQAAGSVISYLRRYSLASMVGVVMVDDDGEAAESRPVLARPTAPPKPANDVAKVDQPAEATADALKAAHKAVAVELTRLKWKTEACREFLKNKYNVERVGVLTLEQATEAAKWLADIKPETKKAE